MKKLTPGIENSVAIPTPISTRVPFHEYVKTSIGFQTEIATRVNLILCSGKSWAGHHEYVLWELGWQVCVARMYSFNMA